MPTKSEEIKSDLTEAQVIATSMKSATTSLSTVTGADKDEQSVLSGNSIAHQVIDAAQDRAKAISESIQIVSQNVHTAAEGFEAVDRQTASDFHRIEDRNRG